VNWGLYDPRREEEIFANLAACNEGPLYSENLREIFEAILHVMKEIRG
jgi:chorismate mutase